MSMTVVVTRNVSARVRGFLASVMLELGPGVYAGLRISPAVRGRVWQVLEDWFANEAQASIIMLWPDKEMPGGLKVNTLGAPPVKLADVNGILLSHRPSQDKAD